MNIELTSGQIALLHISIESPSEGFELYGGTQKGAFQIDYTGSPDYEWLCTIREADVVGTPLGMFNIYARELATGREWVILSGKIIVKPRTASVPADKLHPVEYFVTVPVRNEQVDAAGNVIVRGIPGPKGERGEKGEKGERGEQGIQGERGEPFTYKDFTEEQLASLKGDKGDPGEGAELTAEAIQTTAPLKWGDGVDATGAASAPLALTFGSAFSDTAGSYTCTTQGTGSITIGAGANTLNNGTTESSNSVTIGCKASNSGADSVVIGAQASCAAPYGGGVAIGAATSTGSNGIALGRNANTINGVAIGKGAKDTNGCVAIGRGSSTNAIGATAVGENAFASTFATVLGSGTKAPERGVAIGFQARASTSWQNGYCVAIGFKAYAADYGAVVFRSVSQGATNDKTPNTQLYFSGANTPLANEYEDGEAMLGYVTRDADGNILAAGTQKLSVLCPNNSGFQPMALSLDDEMTPPKVFRPSDLDLPQEEPSEPEEYQPLPVYPIVEPEIEPLTE